VNDLENIKKEINELHENLTFYNLHEVRENTDEIVESAERMANRIAELERATSHLYDENQDGLREIDRLQNKIEQASCETCKSFQEAIAAEIVEGNYWCDCKKMYWGMTDHFHKEKMKCSEWEATSGSE